MDWLNAIVQGTLLGGLYALFAAGLSLIFGVMRLVNIAHGDLIVLSAYLALTVAVTLGLHPLVALLVTLLGAVFAGIFGAILAVPITAVILKVSRELKRVRAEDADNMGPELRS